MMDGNENLFERVDVEDSYGAQVHEKNYEVSYECEPEVAKPAVRRECSLDNFKQDRAETSVEKAHDVIES